MTMVGRWWESLWTWITGPSFDEDVEKVRLACVRCCGFMPTVSCVASILSAGDPAVVGASAVAIAICDVVKAHKWAFVQAGDPPTLNGVVIEGDWVR